MPCFRAKYAKPATLRATWGGRDGRDSDRGEDETVDDDIRRDALEDLNRTYAWLREYTTVKPWAFDLRLAMD